MSISRPATSFLWITSPRKSFKHILWGRYKWYCITLVILFLLFLFFFLFFYSLRSATVNYMYAGMYSRWHHTHPAFELSL
ncbi:hypothetical protein Pmani_011462 [Petrolisthes manimaculis]|uniref:Ferlin C-terminal domain-containing protein n=1 Tax=Petrolisthes manimaculis TaxID=1843537 RepID=A0AAE1Q133_9EUCA|nr:hypothetical protein Pmani_011462 [Petrolisthes manimaculis]